MACPNCGSRLVGKIGNRQFYCWNCCVEFSRRGNEWEVFHVDQDGVLVPNPKAAVAPEAVPDRGALLGEEAMA